VTLHEYYIKLFTQTNAIHNVCMGEMTSRISKSMRTQQEGEKNMLITTGL